MDLQKLATPWTGGIGDERGDDGGGARTSTLWRLAARDPPVVQVSDIRIKPFKRPETYYIIRRPAAAASETASAGFRASTNRHRMGVEFRSQEPRVCLHRTALIILPASPCLVAVAVAVDVGSPGPSSSSSTSSFFVFFILRTTSF